MKAAVRIKIDVVLTLAIFITALASLSLVGCSQPVTECPRVKELIEENRDQLGGYIAIGDAEIQQVASSMECLSCHPDAGNLDYSTLRTQAEFLRRQPVQAQGTFPPFSYDPASIVCYGCHAEGDLLQAPYQDARMVEMNQYISTLVAPGWSLEAGPWRTDYRGDGWYDDDISNGGYDADWQWVESTDLGPTELEDLSANGGSGWEVDQWVGYALVPDDTSPLNYYTIVSNTDTTVTVEQGADMVADGADAGDRYRIEVYYPVVGGIVHNEHSQDANFHYDHMIRYPLILGSWFQVTCTKCHAVDPVTLVHTNTGHPAYTRAELDFEHIDRDLQVGGADEGGWANVDLLNCLTVCHPQTASPDPANAYHRDQRATLPGGDDCLGCHSMQQGSRRQVAGEGGDFQLASHHVIGDVQNEDCTVCHYVANHGSGTVRLKNADTGGTIAYSQVDPSSAEPFCLSCHDDDGATNTHKAGGTALNPFDDGAVLGTPPYPFATSIANSWGKSYGHGPNGGHGIGNTLTCMGTGDPGTGCHGSGGAVNAHGSVNQVLATREFRYDNDDFYDEAYWDLCFNCHGSYAGVAKEDTFGVLSGGILDGGYGPPGPNGSNPPYYTTGVTTHFADHNETGGAYNDPSFWGPPDVNLHWFHIGIQGSSFRGTGAGSGVNCVNCHNVHGSTIEYGATYDEMGYINNTDGTNIWGEMTAAASSLGNFPTYCAFNCHSYQGATKAWFSPIVE
jgi:hypothetical protein